jgi:deazaflavin-dependent oxidoreductase (nitroreductase family)
MAGPRDAVPAGSAHDVGMTTNADPIQLSRTAAPRPSGGVIHTFTVATQRLARPLAGTRWFPMWGVLDHVGRTSGRAYSTPVVALEHGDGYLIPLPFGEGTHWVRNLLAAGGGTLRHRGADHRIADPVIVDLESIADDLPAFARFASRRLGLRHYVLVRGVD